MQDLLTQDRGAVVSYKLVLRQPHAELEEKLKALPGVEDVKLDNDSRGFTIKINEKSGKQHDIMSTVIECNAEVVEFREETKHLNQAFMDLTKAGVRS